MLDEMVICVPDVWCHVTVLNSVITAMDVSVLTTAACVAGDLEMV